MHRVSGCQDGAPRVRAAAADLEEGRARGEGCRWRGVVAEREWARARAGAVWGEAGWWGAAMAAEEDDCINVHLEAKFRMNLQQADTINLRQLLDVISA